MPYGFSYDPTVMHLPAGFKRIEVNDTVVVLRAGLADSLLAAGIQDPETLVQTSPSPLRGRGALGRVSLADGGTAVVRLLRRGGLFGKVVRRLSLDPWRPLSELAVSAEASARGAAVLDVLAAISHRRAFGYHHGVVTREVEGARDLMRVLREDPPGSARRKALRAAGRAVRALHDAGVDHVDLNLKNILLAPDGRAVVIDLDRCRIAERTLPRKVGRRNLLRLLRSWTKLSSVHPDSAHPRDPFHFVLAYAEGDRRLLRRLVSAGVQAHFPLRRAFWRVFPPRIP
jgi:3-deoxy-D-manno-octulosonic acid kinase